jgi:hypothetical protein
MMMKTGVDATSDNYNSFGMEWLPTGSPDVQVNEATTDAELKSYIDLDRDIVFRRVKHFSGYIVITARATESTLGDIIPLW